MLEGSAQKIALIVDDNPETLGMLVSSLEDEGITVLVAKDGHSAIDLAGRLNPDVILLDAVMPGLDGFETCRILKTGPNATPAPIIFMTGLTEPENIVKGLEAGGVDYLSKPIVIEELIARITIHVVNARTIKSAYAALDSSGQSILVFDRNANIRAGSSKAKTALEEVTAQAGQDPDRQQELKLWLMSCAKTAVSQQAPFSIGDLQLQFLGTPSGDEIAVKIAYENTDDAKDVLAAAFGLTQREGEVLQWLSMGKTNRDIAQILSLSSRTINKHLEMIFQKMGVDNRTSAAVLADRALNSH